MRRRWFGIVLMLWASVASLLSYAPTILATGEQYTFVGNNIQGSGGALNGTVTFNSAGGGNYTATEIGNQSVKTGPTELAYTISKVTKVTSGGYSATITCTAIGVGVGCGTLTKAITIADPNGTGPNGGSKTAPPTTTAPGAANPSATQETCDAASLTWLMCPVINVMVGMVNWVEVNVLVPFLKEPPFDKNNQYIAPVYKIWSNFRDVASIFFILVFFLIIFGTAIGFDNYTIKKVLPHLIAGAILVPFSWYICVIGIDIGNILGQGLVALCNSFIPKPTIDFGSDLNTVFYGVGAGLGAALLVGVVVSGMSLGILATILIAVLATFFTLILRKILIILLVVLSPFAFLAWILPNTQKLFKMWWSNMLRLILMYPLIMMLFEAGRLFATVSKAVTGGAALSVAPLFQLAGLFLPLAMVPWTFSMAGSAMKMGGNAIGKVSGAADKKFGRNSDMAKDRKEQKIQNQAIKETTSNSALMRAYHRKRGGFGGFVTPMSGSAKRRMEATSAKALHERQEQEALSKTRDEMGRESEDTIMSRGIDLQQQKLRESRVAEAGQQKIMVYEYNDDGSRKAGSGKQVRISEASGFARDLNEKAREAHAENDYATMIASMQTLDKWSGGTEVNRELREGTLKADGTRDTSQSLFGGTRDAKVNTAAMGGEAQTYYDMAVSQIKPGAADDLTKTKKSAFDALTAQDIGNMNYKTAGEYIRDSTALVGQAQIDHVNEVKSTIQAAIDNPRVQLDAAKLNEMATVAEKHQSIYGADFVNTLRTEHEIAAGLRPRPTPRTP